LLTVGYVELGADVWLVGVEYSDDTVGVAIVVGLLEEFAVAGLLKLS
jgi:hypothetical protein